MPLDISDYGRGNLAELFNELGFKNGAEIGVEEGTYSEMLCKAIPELRLLCVDAWKAYKGYKDHTDQKKLDGFCATATERLAHYDVTIVRKYSMDAVKDVPDGSLDFVYIDANHTFEACTNDIAEWSKKVRTGGIVSGHDYHRYMKHRQIHVVDVVHGYTHAWQIYPWFVTGAKEKVDGKIRDTVRSWFWVKQ